MVDLKIKLKYGAMALAYDPVKGIDTHPTRSIDKDDPRPLEYVAHFPYGNVLVNFDGQQYVINGSAIDFR
jgi:hypothetical protein